MALVEHITAQRAAALALRKTLDTTNESAVSRRLTDDFSASKISVDNAVLHTTPEREDCNKRLYSTSECGEVSGGHPSQDSGSSPQSASTAHDLISQNVEERLRGFLYSWGRKLVELQPKVHMSPHLVESGLFLFKCLRQLQLNACCEGGLTLADLSNEVLLIHDLIACFWIAMKHCSVRTQVPNRTLVSKATGAEPDMLGRRELEALILLDWDVNTLLRFGGLVA